MSNQPLTIFDRLGLQEAEFGLLKNQFSMNQELIYHQKKQQGKMIIAEFLINDFRFWCDVEEGFHFHTPISGFDLSIIVTL